MGAIVNDVEVHPEEHIDAIGLAKSNLDPAGPLSIPVIDPHYAALGFTQNQELR